MEREGAQENAKKSELY